MSHSHVSISWTQLDSALAGLVIHAFHAAALHKDVKPARQLQVLLALRHNWQKRCGSKKTTKVTLLRDLAPTYQWIPSLHKWRSPFQCMQCFSIQPAKYAPFATKQKSYKTSRHPGQLTDTVLALHSSTVLAQLEP